MRGTSVRRRAREIEMPALFDAATTDAVALSALPPRWPKYVTAPRPPLNLRTSSL